MENYLNSLQSFFDHSNCLNLSGEPIDVISNFLYTEGENIYRSILQPVIMYAGLLGNIAFVAVVLIVPYMHTVTNMYLTSLAIADVIFLAVYPGHETWIWYASPIRGDVSPLGKVGCPVVHFIVSVSYCSSLFTITLVTLERFFGICYPLKHRVLAGRKRTMKLITASWCIAVVLGFLYSLLSFKMKTYCIIWPDIDTFKNYPKYFGRCSEISSSLTPYLRVFYLLMFCTVTLGNIVLYIIIMKRMNMRTKTKAHTVSVQQATKIRNAVGKMLILNGAVFFLCQAPYQIVSIIIYVGEYVELGETTTEQLTISLWINNLLLCINSGINPVIYNISNPRCRKAFVEVFTGRYFCRQERDTVMTNTVTMGMTYPVHRNKEENPVVLVAASRI